MLKIENDSLPQTLLSYLAFRLAFRETFERLVLWKQFERDLDDVPGYLGEVPFLRETPARVQLELLASTWSRHINAEQFRASLTDEAVIYAVCETAALIVERDPDAVRHLLHGGPLDLTVPIDQQLASELRGLYLNLTNAGDFLLVSQFLDLPPDDALQLKHQMGMDVAGVEELFEVVGRWHASPTMIERLSSLVTQEEAQRIAVVLFEGCPA